MIKGTRVFLIVDADRKGKVLVRRCTVGSWGKQSIHLVDAISGESIERRLYTKNINKHLNPRVLCAAETPDLYCAARAIAEEFIALHREHISRIINSEDFEEQNPGYKQAVRAQLDAIHEPRVFMWEGHELMKGQAVTS